MEWYLPLTFLPSLGLIVMSTANQLMTLSSEINGLVSQNCSEGQKNVAKRKIKQLERLTRALTLLYFSSVCFTLAGLFQFFSNQEIIGKWGLAIGTLTFFLALAKLTIYSFRAVKIRKDQFQERLETQA